MLARSCPTGKRSLTGRPFVEPKSNAFLYGLRFSLSRFVLPIIADGFPALEDENFEHLPPHAVPAFATLTWALVVSWAVLESVIIFSRVPHSQRKLAIVGKMKNLSDYVFRYATACCSDIVPRPEFTNYNIERGCTTSGCLRESRLLHHRNQTQLRLIETRYANPKINLVFGEIF